MIAGMRGSFRPSYSLEFGFGSPEHTAGCGIGSGDSPIGVGQEDGVGTVFKEEAIKLFALDPGNFFLSHDLLPTRKPSSPM